MRSLLPNTAVIIAAAGSGERLGADLPKALVQLVGRTLIEHAVASAAPIASQIIVAAPGEYVNQIRTFFGDSVEVIAGGESRTQSVKIALERVRENIQYVLVHDAARCLAPTSLFENVISTLESGEQAVIPVLAVSDTIKKVNKKGYVTKTPKRSRLRAVQTPQGFTREVLTWAHAQDIEGTDDASLVENLNIDVKTIAGEIKALKITTSDDLATATKYLIGSYDIDIRVGVGTDAHAYSDDPFRPMWLAGLMWEGHPGVDGHSDGDVAAHAICDSLFAATGQGDLGSNFGVDRVEYEKASGATLLSQTLEIIKNAGFEIHNVSVQIVGNKPKIGPRRAEAIRALSSALGGAPVSVTATTTDGLGFTGQGLGLSAIATSLVTKTK